MGLSFSLLMIFLLFCLLMAGVLAFCLRERDGGHTIDHSPGNAHFSSAPVPEAMISLHSGPANPADEEKDLHVAMILFGSIFVGALLAVITGYLVFFREWGV